ncbi:MAG: SufS family cysteine desulfurase [Candidatus Micrarchaeota archaeon]
MLDAKKIRADFPILRTPGLIYLDSAATSQRPRQVVEAVVRFYEERNSNVARGLYPIAEEATLEFENVREKARRFINAPSSHGVISVKNTTEAANVVMRGWGEKNVKKGGKVVTTVLEHHSNFVPWQQLARMTGARFVVVDVDDEGRIDQADLEKRLKGASLFAFSAASNVTGTLSDARKLCAMSAEAGAVSVVDGAQSVPSMPTDVKRMGCDFLMFSGHKMLAPFGAGVLYGREELLEGMDPFMYGSEMIRNVSAKKSEWNELPYKFEPGTPAVDAVIGLGAALDYLGRLGMGNVRKHEERLVSYMLERLGEVKGLSVIGPRDAGARAGLAAFTLEGVHPHDVAAMLAEDGICVRSGHHCAMPIHEKLKVPATTRASVYIYNLEEEIDMLVSSLQRAKKVFG